MRKAVFVMLASALAPFCFAVDGVVLINQATVTAAGGFPYLITQPGSYKLSGNLTATANFEAIVIAASNVVLDLNGFTVSCSLANGQVTNFLECIGNEFAPGPFRNIAIRNGTITESFTGSSVFVNTQYVLVGLGTSSNVILDELLLDLNVPQPIPSSVTAYALKLGPHSIVRHTIMNNVQAGFGFLAGCPSLFVENVSLGFNFSSGGNCVNVNNVGF